MAEPEPNQNEPQRSSNEKFKRLGVCILLIGLLGGTGGAGYLAQYAIEDLTKLEQSHSPVIDEYLKFLLKDSNEQFSIRSPYSFESYHLVLTEQGYPIISPYEPSKMELNLSSLLQKIDQRIGTNISGQPLQTQEFHRKDPIEAQEYYNRLILRAGIEPYISTHLLYASHGGRQPITPKEIMTIVNHYLPQSALPHEKQLAWQIFVEKSSALNILLSSEVRLSLLGSQFEPDQNPIPASILNINEFVDSSTSDDESIVRSNVARIAMGGPSSSAFKELLISRILTLLEPLPSVTAERNLSHQFYTILLDDYLLYDSGNGIKLNYEYLETIHSAGLISDLMWRMHSRYYLIPNDPKAAAFFEGLIAYPQLSELLQPTTTPLHSDHIIRDPILAIPMEYIIQHMQQKHPAIDLENDPIVFITTGILDFTGNDPQRAYYYFSSNRPVSSASFDRSIQNPNQELMQTFFDNAYQSLLDKGLKPQEVELILIPLATKHLSNGYGNFPALAGRISEDPLILRDFSEDELNHLVKTEIPLTLGLHEYEYRIILIHAFALHGTQDKKRGGGPSNSSIILLYKMYGWDHFNWLMFQDHSEVVNTWYQSLSEEQQVEMFNLLLDSAQMLYPNGILLRYMTRLDIRYENHPNQSEFAFEDIYPLQVELYTRLQLPKDLPATQGEQEGEELGHINENSQGVYESLPRNISEIVERIMQFEDDPPPEIFTVTQGTSTEARGGKYSNLLEALKDWKAIVQGGDASPQQLIQVIRYLQINTGTPNQRFLQTTAGQIIQLTQQNKT